jgi:hypothetical protein
MKNKLGFIAIIAIIGFLAACGNVDTPTVEHTHAWGDWTVTKAATCSAKGEETRVCTLDPSHKETRDTETDPDAHDWEQLEGTAPTCEDAGSGKRKCKLCGVEESGDLPALGHDWGEWVETKAPTETEDGQEERICGNDSTHKETRVKAALNHTHDWGDWTVTTPATCTANGERKRVCKLNANHFETEVIAKLEHDWDEWEVVTAATCTTEGEKTRTCKRDSSHTETLDIDIDQDAHNYQWQTTTTATFTSEGVETEICSRDATHIGETRTSDPLPITTAAEWDTAIATISGGGNDKTYDINVTGEFSIPGSSYSSSTFGNVTGVTVNIRGAGTITLSASSTENLLYVRSNQTVSLKDTHLKGHSTNNTSLVYVYDGTFNMSGGTISNNTAAFDGGGVYVNANATFTMSGGTISGNTAGYGGGVCLYRGGTFNMTGGTISGNTSNGNNLTGGGGGGVCLDEGGTFNMSGTAKIIDNIANDGNGGGVHMNARFNDVTFNMMGGTISGNQATGGGGSYGGGGRGGGISSTKNYDISSIENQIEKSFLNITGGTISGNTAVNGGGVDFGEGTFTMSGGTISNNTATKESGSGGGGGVYITYGLKHETIFNMTGGNITGNNTPLNGGGVLMSGQSNHLITSTMSGGTITNNNAGAAGGGLYAVSSKFNLGSLDFITGNTAVTLVMSNSTNQVMFTGSNNMLINGSTPDASLKWTAGYAW